MGDVTRLVTGQQLQSDLQHLGDRIHAACTEYFDAHEHDHPPPAATILVALVNELAGIAAVTGIPAADVVEHFLTSYERQSGIVAGAQPPEVPV
jgi:hypothetical protein